MKGFILYPTYRIEEGKAFVYLFGRLEDGRSFCTKNFFKPYFFIKKKDFSKAKNLASFDFEETSFKSVKNDDVVKIVLDIPKEVPDIRKLFEDHGIDCFEADIRFAYRFMIDNGLKGSVNIEGLESKSDLRVDVFFEEPKLTPCNYSPSNLKILSIDIETSMKGDFYCVSLVSNDDSLKEVLILNKEGYKDSISFKKEKELFESFKKKIVEFDPDIITGWNVIDFDFDYLRNKFKELGISFDLGRLEDDCQVTVFSDFLTDSKADFKGRLVLDGIHLLKSNFISLPDYKLETAAGEFADADKLITGGGKGEEIEKAYASNPQKLIDYNLIDSKLVLDILSNSGVLNLTIKRSLLTGMPLDRVRASIASFDSLYLKELRSRGFVAPSAKYHDRNQRTTGGFVMSPTPGIYNFVAVFDFKSLYPSIMRTFNIDPLSYDAKEDYITAPNGARFSRKKAILPSVLESLGKERSIATKNKDMITRGAIKILMNSLYGVLASPNCRFYNFEIANAITSFGHMLIKKTAELGKEKGMKPIYGDTDSVFLDLDVKEKDKGVKIAKDFESYINKYFNDFIEKEYSMSSALEIEFEKFFIKFFMPKVRGSDAGAKKRYAGLVDGRIDFTGLEFVRRDWTEVSKKFQLELLDRVFKEKDIDNYIRSFVKDLKSGKYDDLLIYRKALRKSLDKYTKTTPPHVKAARKLDKITSNIIDYILTIEGPEPIEKIEHSIDYDHYIEKQIKPLADSVLYFYDKNFDDVLKGSSQTSLSSF
ncbi:MAG: DNA polymerase II [Candidatus Woesearchaeota archaeon]